MLREHDLRARTEAQERRRRIEGEGRQLQESLATLEGRVAWRRQTPGNEGVGVEFRCRDIAGMRRLRELVKRIEKIET